MAVLKPKSQHEAFREINTKLGKITINSDEALYFPHGIVGLRNKHHYCLADIPDSKLPGAFILQSVEEDKLSFIVLPLAQRFYSPAEGLLSYDSVLEAATSYRINPASLDLLVIATLSQVDNKPKISINLKAPLLIDRTEKVAYQHVFIRHDYPLVYYLN